MEKKKEESALSVLMRYAGGHKYCTYFSWVFSGLSAIAALLTYVFLFRIIKEVIEAAPNFKEAIHIASNGWFAVLAAAVSMSLDQAGSAGSSMIPQQQQRYIWHISSRILSVLISHRLQ